MKFALTLISAALLFIASAGAQSVTLISGGTNNVAGVTTNTYNLLIDSTKQENVAVAISFSLSAGGTSNIIFGLQRAHDGTIVDTANTANITIAANGTNPVYVVTNIATAGAPFIRLATVANTNSAPSSVTNLTVKYYVKKIAN